MTASARGPDFLFIGPDKAGSSWLHELLLHHPDCYVPPAKDIYFFDRYYARGWPWYLAHFAPAPPGCRALGELSHDYLFSGAARDRIAAGLPEVRLLTILREPVERSFSHYLYMVRSGRTRLGFEQALEAFPEIENNSLYGRHLDGWFRRFPRDRIGVFFFDDLERDPRHFASEVLGFLGLGLPEDHDFARRVRPAAAARSALAARAGRMLGAGVRELGFPNLVGRVKRSRAMQLLYRAYPEAERPRIPDPTREALRRRFAPDLQLLAGLLDGEGPGWLPRKPAPGAAPVAP